MTNVDLIASRPSAHEIGYSRQIDDATGRYVVFCKSTFPNELTLDGLKIVVDSPTGLRIAQQRQYLKN